MRSLFPKGSTMNRLLAALCLICVGGLAVPGPGLPMASAQEVSGDLTVTQWVRPKVRSKFTAQVVAPVEGGLRLIENAEVVMFNAAGESFRGESDSNGNVTILGVVPGVYAMKAQGEGVSAAYAMHVAGAEHAKPGLLPAIAIISCADVPFHEFRDLVSAYLPSKYERATLKLDDVDVESSLPQIRGNERFRVVRTNGGLVGHIYAGSEGWAGDAEQDSELDAADRMNVFLYQDGEQLGRTLTDSNGRFEFANLDPGIYAIVAAGKHGVSAVGFELLDLSIDGAASVMSSQGHRFVSKLANGDQGFGLQSIPMTPEELEDSTLR